MLSPTGVGKAVPAFLVAFFAVSVPARAFWVWTPQKGKFENPSQTARATASEQYQAAYELYKAHDYDKAVKEFEKVVKRFKDSEEAPDAALFIGLCYEEKGDYYEAYLRYQEVLVGFPQTRQVRDIVERQFRIANLFYKREKTTIAGVTVPILPSLAREKALEIYRRVVENEPFGPYAPASYQQIGLILSEDGKYAQAIQAFEKVAEEFPSSDYAEEAEFQIARATYELAGERDYDAARIAAALEKLESFSRRHPDSQRTVEVSGLIQDLYVKQAQEHFNIAAFYEKQNYLASAKLYYRDVVKNFSGTEWARQARRRLEALGAPVQEKESTP